MLKWVHSITHLTRYNRSYYLARPLTRDTRLLGHPSPAHLTLYIRLIGTTYPSPLDLTRSREDPTHGVSERD